MSSRLACPAAVPRAAAAHGEAVAAAGAAAFGLLGLLLVWTLASRPARHFRRVLWADPVTADDGARTGAGTRAGASDEARR